MKKKMSSYEMNVRFIVYAMPIVQKKKLYTIIKTYKLIIYKFDSIAGWVSKFVKRNI